MSPDILKAGVPDPGLPTISWDLWKLIYLPKLPFSHLPSLLLLSSHCSLPTPFLFVNWVREWGAAAVLWAPSLREGALSSSSVGRNFETHMPGPPHPWVPASPLSVPSFLTVFLSASLVFFPALSVYISHLLFLVSNQSSNSISLHWPKRLCSPGNVLFLLKNVVCMGSWTYCRNFTRCRKAHNHNDDEEKEDS